MVQPPEDDWGAWLDAARRKIAIARYHQDLLDRLEYPGAYDYVEIPIQAHLEGILFSVSAASDQVARALNDAEALRIAPRRANLSNVLERLATAEGQGWSPDLEMLLGELAAWNDEPLIADARALRNRAGHSHYDKQSGRYEILIADDGHNAYQGSRDVLIYCHDLVTHLRELDGLVERLGNILDRQ